MSSQANVQSVESLEEFRVALAMFGEDMMSTLGAAEAELRRTLQWLQQERPTYWQEQIKRRQELASQARAELFRRKLQKTADNNPAMSEQKENLRRAEAAVIDAEKRLALVRKWQPILHQASLEYHGSVQRLKDLSRGDVPSAVNLLTRLIAALESYLQLAPPSGKVLEAATASGGSVARSSIATGVFTTIATQVLDEQAEIDETIAAEQARSENTAAVNDQLREPDGPADPASGAIE